MRLLSYALCSLFLLAGCSSTPQKNHLGHQIIPLEDFFKNPVVNQYQISPDGKYLAYLKPYQTRMNVFVQKTGDPSSEVRLTNQTDRDIAGFAWKESDRILFVRDFGGDENFHIFSVSVEGGDAKDLTPFENVRAGIISDLDGIDPDHIIIRLNKRDAKVFDAYRLNTKTGELQLVAKNPGNFTGWNVDHKGRLRVATATDGVDTSIYYRETEEDAFKEVLKTNFKDSVSPVFFTFDNKNLYVLSNLNRDKTSVVVFDPRKKRELETVFERPDVDIQGLTYSKKRSVLVSASYVTWKTERKFFDDTFAQAYATLQKKIPGREIAITSVTRDESKAIVRTYSDRSLGDYYLFDISKGELQHLANLSPWLDENKLSEMKPITYKSRDGLTIHGYLVLPKGGDGKNLPVVVNPHGGPWARDVWRFNPEAQFLANRGYAVFQMNFRGSTGYGKKFWQSSFKQWGRKMQDDITDGVKYLIDEGVADADRVCIYGGSYGGYAVLAGLSFTPDLYACGVDYVGVSNLFTLMETIPPYWEPYREMFYEMVGHPEKDKKLVMAASPVFHADKIRAPLFVAQGAKDPRVKKSESDQIVAALKKRGIEVPYLVKENEGHGFRNEENKFEFYSLMETFLEKHLLQ